MNRDTDLQPKIVGRIVRARFTIAKKKVQSTLCDSTSHFCSDVLVQSKLKFIVGPANNGRVIIQSIADKIAQLEHLFGGKPVWPVEIPEPYGHSWGLVTLVVWV